MSTVTDIGLETMTGADLDEVVAIDAETSSTPWSWSLFNDELARPESRWYVVARIDDEIVGFAGLMVVPDPDGDQAHVTTIAVSPEFRRRGIGARLMSALGRHARGRGCVSWTLEVRESNHAAIELYRRFGFAPVGTRPSYYSGNETALIMWCHDLAADDYEAVLSGKDGSQS
ncbi:MAG: ribosomal-protein-alanine N-acetyltransferase [Ilumatobacter coccineus]|uniref:Ribosomal-protein-alanine N-acetyltransferase n=1 Tax=Ilumatobacter coccineus TaxID=467094 RepID=A0A2G6KAH3_9ACTN|nr:MAG: ribosomal-protein-alanine N-acetyltransferase [Ilumatobacter coccineus]